MKLTTALLTARHAQAPDLDAGAGRWRGGHWLGALLDAQARRLLLRRRCRRNLAQLAAGARHLLRKGDALRECQHGEWQEFDIGHAGLDLDVL